MSLDDLRAIGDKTPKKEPWKLEPFAPLWEGVVVAFDQSLAKTGCTTLHVYGSLQGLPLGIDNLAVSTRMFKTDSDFSGHEGNLQRAEEQYQAYLRYLSLRDADLVVHETPPSAGGMSRPESSLLAAREVRRACMALEIPYLMIGAQTAKKRMTGNANAKKSDLAKGVRELIPHLANLKPNNEDTCDAAALAVVAFEMENPTHGSI